jgi:hypothetical protein
METSELVNLFRSLIIEKLAKSKLIWLIFCVLLSVCRFSNSAICWPITKFLVFQTPLPGGRLWNRARRSRFALTMACTRLYFTCRSPEQRALPSLPSQARSSYRKIPAAVRTFLKFWVGRLLILCLFLTILGPLRVAFWIWIDWKITSVLIARDNIHSVQKAVLPF